MIFTNSYYYFCSFFIVPSPLIDMQPARNIVTYYAGENLNFTCSSSVMGVVFNWSASIALYSETPLVLQYSTVDVDTNSILVFSPIIISKTALVEGICAISYPDNEKVIGIESRKALIFKSENIE